MVAEAEAAAAASEPCQEPSSFNSRFEYRFIDTNYFKVLKLQNQLIQNSSFYNHLILFAFLKIFFSTVKESLGTLALKKNYLV